MITVKKVSPNAPRSYFKGGVDSFTFSLLRGPKWGYYSDKMNMGWVLSVAFTLWFLVSIKKGNGRTRYEDPPGQMVLIVINTVLILIETLLKCL